MYIHTKPQTLAVHTANACCITSSPTSPALQAGWCPVEPGTSVRAATPVSTHSSWPALRQEPADAASAYLLLQPEPGTSVRAATPMSTHSSRPALRQEPADAASAYLLLQPIVVLHDGGHGHVGALHVERDLCRGLVLQQDMPAQARLPGWNGPRQQPLGVPLSGRAAQTPPLQGHVLPGRPGQSQLRPRRQLARCCAEASEVKPVHTHVPGTAR